jgi:transcriptional regulator with XRE-family HTH domain
MAKNGCVTLNRNLIALRESRGKTREEVCVETGISLNQLTVWETVSNNVPTYRALARLCDYYRYYDIYKMITEEIRFAFNPLFNKPDRYNIWKKIPECG